MLIEGPLKIGVLDRTDSPGRELHFTFTPEFRHLEPSAQGEEMRRYLTRLAEQIQSIADESDPNRQGMLIVLQVAEQLLPHVEAGEMAMEETIVVEMGAEEAAGISVIDLLKTGDGGGYA
jgi:hypothetical protein